MLCFPNARITLGLYVKEKRKDGFHNIETVMLPVSMHDVLEIVPSFDNKTKLIQSGRPLPGNPDENIVMRALRLMQTEKTFQSDNASETLQSLHIYLRKRIPAGSGLAGGSSNGTFMLKALNNYFQLHLSEQQLMTLAAKLGSDCTFFLYNKPMLAEGRGEKLQPIQIPEIHKFHVIIAIPPIHINTAHAYKQIRPVDGRTGLQQTLNQPIENWRHNLKNDFEHVSFKEHPYLETIKGRFIELGASYASMSGSGSAIYGLFEDSDVLPTLRKELPDCYIGIYRILAS